MSTCPQEASVVPRPTALEKRIISALEEYEAEKTPAKYYIRSLCTLATLCVSRLTEERKPIQVPCPKDEERRAKTSPFLGSIGANQISLYPLTEEAYGIFSAEVQSFGRGEGEYICFTRNGAGDWVWEKFI